jgi:hypothetical protein
MKGFFAVFMAAVMSLGTAASVFAEDTKTEQQAVLEKIKPRIGNTDEYENFHSSVYGNGDDRVFCFEWSTEDGKNFSVSATKDGVITNYYKYEVNEYATESVSKNAGGEMAAKAEKLAEMLNPDLDIKVKAIRGYSDNLSFNVQRIENGIPVESETGYIQLKDGGNEIKEFYIDYNCGYKFDSVSKVISKEEARKAFSEKIGLKAVYCKDYGKNDGNDIYMAYVPAKTGVYINALNGMVFEPKYGDYKFASNSSAGMAEEDAAEDSGALSETEIKEFEKINGLMTKDQLFSKLKAIAVLGLGSDCKAENFDLYYDSYKDIYCAYISFSEGNGDNKINGYASMDAKTGEVLNYNRYIEKEGTAFEESAGSAKAVAALKALAGEKAAEYEKSSYNSDKYYTNVTYARYVNGIECTFDGATVGLNSDGTVRNYYISYTKENFPSKANAITAQAAEDKIFSEISYDVRYIGDVDSRKYVPAYVFGAYDVSVNAITGEFVNDVTQYDDISFEGYYNDIAESYAKDMIVKIAEQGIYFADKSFKPDENIKQKDLLAMLHNVFSYSTGVINDETYDVVYRWAKRNGVLKEGEENREAAVTRLEAAKFIIRYMGCEDVAKLDIYVPKFNDVKRELGYTSILSGMGIMNGNGKGGFNPDGLLKRADAAVVVYKCINR